jgi:CBS domain-containing protein
MAAARTGINSTFLWLDEKRYGASELVLKELLPVARQGLLDHGIDKDDVSYYLGIIEERAKAQKTGAQWILNSYNALSKISNREEALSTITAKTIANQQAGIPVHKWALADFDDVVSWQPDSILVEEFMTTDVFTVQKDDILELVAEMMDWNKIRYLPVENKKGELDGLLTSRLLLRFFSKDHIIGRKSKPHLVKSVMISEPVTVSPEASIMKAMSIMRDNQFGCLPVVKQKKLVGIITEQDFLKITERLMKRFAALKSTI